MSGYNPQQDDLLVLPFAVVSDAVRKHRAAPPNEQAENLVYWGGMIVGAGTNLAVHFAPHARDFSIAVKLGFAAVMLWGLAWIVSGWRSRGQRNIGSAITSVVAPGLGFYLATTYAPWVFHYWWVHTICTAIIVANALSAAACLAGRSGSAFDLVVEDIATNEWQW